VTCVFLASEVVVVVARSVFPSVPRDAHTSGISVTRVAARPPSVRRLEVAVPCSGEPVATAVGRRYDLEQTEPVLVFFSAALTTYMPGFINTE